MLRDCWIQASQELGINVVHDGMAEYKELLEDGAIYSPKTSEKRTVIVAEKSLAVCMKVANQILLRKSGGILVITGSLHIVSAVISTLNE